MSDLISRSKLIDYFYFGIDDKPIIDGISDRKIIDIIKNQPTAYSVDKVVEELETNKQNALEVEESIKEYNVWNKAIEIVKQGGISDDVCEWVIVDRPHNLPIYNTSCGKIRLQYVTGADIYCNGCGKKIKVVE